LLLLRSLRFGKTCSETQPLQQHRVQNLFLKGNVLLLAPMPLQHLATKTNRIKTAAQSNLTSLSLGSPQFMSSRFTSDFIFSMQTSPVRGVVKKGCQKLAKTLGTENAVTATLNSTFITRTRLCPSVAVAGAKSPTKT